MGLITSIRDLDRLQGELDDIGSELSIEPGSYARVACQFYPYWGVNVTKRNRPHLKELTERINRLEWKGGGEELDIAVHRAVAKANLISDNNDLNSMLARLAVVIIDSMDDGKSRFRLGDIGAGTGKTCTAVFDLLENQMGQKRARNFAERLELICIEPSMARMPQAYDNLERLTLRPGSIAYFVGSLNQYFATLEDRHFDMFISSSTCHHFPFPDYLHMMRRALKPEGVIVIGDWYQLFCAHPIFTVHLLERIKAGKDRVEKFKDLFNIKEDDYLRFLKERRVTPPEISGIEAGLLYLSALAEEMKHVKGARFFFLEALETFQDRVKKVQEAGFETDIRELKKHKGFVNLTSNIRKAYPHSDITNVIAAAKLRKPGRPRKELLYR